MMDYDDLDGPPPTDDDAPGDELAPRRHQRAATKTRVPPHDLDAEAALIGSMLISTDAIRAGGHLHASDFYRPVNGTIYAAVVAMYDHGEPTDPVTVAHRTGQPRAELIAYLDRVPASANAAAYARIVQTTARARHTLTLTGELADAIYDGADWVGYVERIAATPVDALNPTNLRIPNLAERLERDEPDEQPTILTGSTAPLIYPGRYHDIHGEPSHGKSWVAFHAAAEVLTTTDQGVVYIDWEDSVGAFLARMSQLGVPRDILADPERVAYINPQGPIGAAEREALLAAARAVDAALVVIDAMAPALALDGMDEISNTDVTAWLARVVQPLCAAGHAVLSLDHITKDPTTRVRGGRGAGAKLAAITGASYSVILVTPFSPKQAGEIKLKIAKDRPGAVGPINSIAAHIRITPSDGGKAVRLDVRPPETTVDERGQFVPTHLMEKVSRHFEALPVGSELSKRMICESVKGKHQHLRTAVDRLHELGHIESDLSGTNPVFRLVEPYREPVETDTEPPRVPRVPTASHRVPGRGANPDTSARVPASPGYYRPGTRDAADPDAWNPDASPIPNTPDEPLMLEDGEPW